MAEPTLTAERTGDGRFAPGNPRRFPKGRSGCPGGASRELRTAKREAIAVLRSMLGAPDLETQISAALAILAVPPRHVAALVESLSIALRNIHTQHKE